MFKSKQALQKDIVSHGITIAASATIDTMITALSRKMQGLEGNRGRVEGTSGQGSREQVSRSQYERGRGRGGRGSGRGARMVTSSDANTEALQCLLKRSFQKRLKGKAREHVSLGHLLEAPIFQCFMQDVNYDNEIDGVDVLSAYTTGLVAKKN